MPVPLKPIGRIQNMIEKLGLTITYAYDNLVFIEHNAFLVEMGMRGEDVSIFVNVDADEKVYPDVIKKLVDEGKKEELVVVYKGKYRLDDAGNEKLNITFLPAA